MSLRGVRGASSGWGEMHQDWDWVVQAPDDKVVGVWHRKLGKEILSIQEIFELRDLMQERFGLWTGLVGPKGKKVSNAFAALLEVINGNDD